MHRQYWILGAGPAGLQLSYHLKMAGIEHGVLERSSSAGSFFESYPRHRQLISINKSETGFNDDELKLRWDWNSLLCDDGEFRVPKFTEQYFPDADDFVLYLRAFATRYELPIEFGADIVRIEKADGLFRLEDRSGRAFTCERLIIATGLPKVRALEFPGSELVESYADIPTDPEAFRGERVLIIGKGNSGFETADSMVGTTAAIHMLSPKPIRLAWRTHYVGDLRAVNNSVLDTYQLKSQNTILDASVDRLSRAEDGSLEAVLTYAHARGQQITLKLDRAINCTGFEYDRSPFGPSCKPVEAYKGKFPEMTSSWESTNVPGMYFAGVLTHMRDYRKSFSGFIHGFRYNTQALAKILSERHHGESWPVRELDSSVEAVEAFILERVHKSSAMFQQPAFFGDVVAFSLERPELACYADIPLEYFAEERGRDHADYFTLTMEYGQDDHPDPFAIERFPDDGAKSTFIHPVVRRYVNGRVVAEHHVPEDLENDWYAEMYRAPLRVFLEEQLSFTVLPKRKLA
ncbi:MAG: NAD(P)-binding domain-containing protein [Nannocystaceae bacterium]|nr:NAD(P)-binding domain-containing protein [Nannocystaceae bacterium]